MAMVNAGKVPEEIFEDLTSNLVQLQSTRMWSVWQSILKVVSLYQNWFQKRQPEDTSSSGHVAADIFWFNAGFGSIWSVKISAVKVSFGLSDSGLAVWEIVHPL